MVNNKWKLREINIEQTKFYDEILPERKTNPVMRAWGRTSKKMYDILKETGMYDDLYEIQANWMGNLSKKKVLDFGCYAGNHFSLKMAEEANEYLAIDLSPMAIMKLKNNLENKNIKNVRALALDILSDDFKERNFDLIYAQGVIHHFKYIDVILERLYEILADEGTVITGDPLQTAFTSKIARSIFRPFQSNKDWEWPFTKVTIKKIRRYFEVIEIQGFMGLAKWSIPLSILYKPMALNMAKKLHRIDMASARYEDKRLWRCLQVMMLWKKRPSIQ